MAYDANESCILVSRDTVLRIKCKTVGITCEDYRKLNVVANAAALYSGLMECDELDVQELYSMNGQEAEAVLPENVLSSLKPNEFLSVRNGQSSYLARFVGPKRPLKPVSGDGGSSSKIKPRNREQRLAFDLLHDEGVKLVTLTGRAGGGKSLCVLDAGLEQVLNKKRYASLVVCRPVMPVGKDIGFLPGGLSEKMEPWMAPIKDNLRFILNINAGMAGGEEKSSHGKKSRKSSGGSFEETMRISDKGHLESILQSYFDEGIIEIQPLTYIRGRSISNAFIIVDEAQNTSLHEIKTILTRAGEGTKIVLTGDIEQIDRNDVDSVSNGLTAVVEKFKDNPIAGHVSLVKGERSQLATIAAEILG
jgi:PhoH-like ATPase